MKETIQRRTPMSSGPTIEERMEILESVLSTVQNLTAKVEKLEREVARLIRDGSNPFAATPQGIVVHTTGHKEYLPDE
jgi:hypothetical protein